MDNKTAEHYDVVADQLEKALSLIAERRKTHTGLGGIEMYVKNALNNYRLDLNQTATLQTEIDRLKGEIKDSFSLDFIMWYSSMSSDKIKKAYLRWLSESMLQPTGKESEG